MVVWVGVEPPADERVAPEPVFAEGEVRVVNDPNAVLGRWFLHEVLPSETRRHPLFSVGAVWDSFFFYPAGASAPSIWGGPVVRRLDRLEEVFRQR